MEDHTGNPPASPLRHRIADALAEAREAKTLLAAATGAQDRAITTLEGALEATLQRGVEALAEDLPPPSEHRRQHRKGFPAKLALDPELRAFVEARLDHLTFQQIEEAVAANFPPDRRVGSSSIHAWHQRLQDRGTQLPAGQTHPI